MNVIKRIEMQCVVYIIDFKFFTRNSKVKIVGSSFAGCLSSEFTFKNEQF